MDEQEFNLGDTVIVKPEARDEDTPWHTEPGIVDAITEDGWIIVTWLGIDLIAEEFHPSELEKVIE